MYIPHFQITPIILKNIEGIGQVFGYLQAISLPLSYQQEYIQKIAAETIHASTAIEGNTLTRDQVEQVIGGQKIQAIRRDVREVKNYFQTLQHIKTLASKTNGFNDLTILELHRRMLSGVDDAIAGRYRNTQVVVGDYLPPEAWRVPDLMKEFVDWINQPLPQGLSPIIYAGIAHYQLVAIHAFQDGNGRTSRAFVTLYLMKNSYDVTGTFALESYYNRERDNYYNALSTADKMKNEDGQPDLTKWLEYFTTGFLVEALRAQSRIREFLTNNKLLSGISLTPTQRVILQISASKGTAQMADYIDTLRLSQRGIYKALRKLLELELLQQLGERKGTRYTITQKGLDYIKT